MILAASPAGTLALRAFPAVAKVWISSGVSEAVLEGSGCKANVACSVPGVPAVPREGSLRG